MSGRAKLFAISLTVVLGLFSGSGEAANLVVNGNFSSGNTGFDTDYTFVSAPNPPAPPCAPFISEGCYAIAYTAHNPPQYTVKDYYSGFTAIPDHTGGTPGAMLFANGAPASNFVWKQTLTVLPNTTYLFSAWVSSGLNDPAPANLRFQVDTSAGCSGSSSFTGIGTLNANTAPGWVQGYATFRTGSSTSVCVGLLNQNSAANGNDFAIDDLSVDTDSRAPTASNATVSTPKGVAGTRNVVTSDVTAGSSPVNAASVDLDPAVIGRQTSWVFTNATGTVTFTVDTAGLVTFTPSANFLGTATCSWRVFTTDATPVPSNVATLSVTVSSVTPAPTASNTGPYCAGATISLSASTVAGATYAWTGPNSYTSSAQNPTIASATVAMAGTYSVTATVGGTTSLPGTTTVVVNAVPSAPTASNTGPYAVGNTISLTASTVAGATYAWTGPNSFTSTQQNPTIAGATAAMAGTYSVTATVGGCTSVAGTTTVVVSGAVPAPTASNTGPYCAGATISLSASTVAGATYAWTGPNGFTSSAQNPTIASATVAMAGTYSVTATVGTCTSAAGTTTVVISGVTPAPTASNTGPYCAGATISLSASTVAGATYAWTGPNSFTSSAQNPTIASATVAMAGTYSVTATVGGTISLPGTTTVVVNAVPSAPTASNTGPYAVGATISLSASTVAGATYAWTGPNGFTSSAQNPTIASATVAMAGTYSVTATAGGCASAAGTTVVTVNPYPAPTAYSVNPNAGALAGGTAVTISGTGFRMGVLVKFGANAGTLTSLSPTSVTVTTPAGAAAGSVTVTVRNTDGQTATAPAFTYNPSGCWPDASSEKSRMTGPCYPPVGGSPSSSSSTPLAVQTPNPTTFVGPAAWDSSSPDANTFIFFSGLPPVPTGAARGFAPRSVGVAPGEAITGCYRRMPAEGKMDVAVFQGGAAAPSSGGGPGTLAATGFGVAVTKYEGTTVVGQTKVEMASSKGNGVFDRIRIDGGELDLPIVTFDSNGDGVADYMSVPWGMLAAYGWSTDASGFIGNGGTPGPTPQIWMPLADTDGDGYGDSIVFDDGTGKPSTVFPKFPPMLPPFSQRNDLAVPALGEWGLFAFALSLAAAGWYAIRRTIG